MGNLNKTTWRTKVRDRVVAYATTPFKKTLSLFLILSLINSNCLWAYGSLGFVEEELHPSQVTRLHDSEGRKHSIVDSGTRHTREFHTVLDKEDFEETDHVVFASPEDTDTLYTRAYNSEPVTLAGVIESQRLVGMRVGNPGGVHVERAEFQGIHSLTLGAGALYQTTQGMAYDVADGDLVIAETQLGSDHDPHRLSLVGRHVKLNQSILAPTESLEITVGSHLHGVAGWRGTPPEKGPGSASSAVPTPALEIDSVSHLSSKRVFIESLDEGAEIKSYGYLSSEGDLVIRALGDIYLGQIAALGNLDIITTGNVYFEQDVVVTGRTSVKAQNISLGNWQSEGRVLLEAARTIHLTGAFDSADNITLKGQDDITLEGNLSTRGQIAALSKKTIKQYATINSQGPLRLKGENIDIGESMESQAFIKCMAHKNIKFKSGKKIDISGKSTFRSKRGRIENFASLSFDTTPRFHAPETKNHKSLVTQDSLYVEGIFENARLSTLRAGTLPDLQAFLDHNRGTIELVDSFTFAEPLRVQGRLTTLGRINFEGPSFAVEKKAKFDAQGATNFLTSHFNNQGMVRAHSHFSLRGESFENEGTMHTLGAHSVQVSGLYRDRGTLYAPGLSQIHAGDILLEAGHRSHLKDTILHADRTLTVQEGATFNFYGPSFLFDIDSGGDMFFDGTLAHDSGGYFPVLEFTQVFDPDFRSSDQKNSKKKRLEDTIQSLIPREWLDIRKPGPSRVFLRSRENLRSRMAHVDLLSGSGSVSLIAGGTIDTHGSIFKSGTFQGDHVTAQAKEIILYHSQLQSILGDTWLIADEEARIGMGSEVGTDLGIDTGDRAKGNAAVRGRTIAQEASVSGERASLIATESVCTAPESSTRGIRATNIEAPTVRHAGLAEGAEALSVFASKELTFKGTSRSKGKVIALGTPLASPSGSRKRTEIMSLEEGSHLEAGHLSAAADTMEIAATVKAGSASFESDKGRTRHPDRIFADFVHVARGEYNDGAQGAIDFANQLRHAKTAHIDARRYKYTCTKDQTISGTRSFIFDEVDINAPISATDSLGMDGIKDFRTTADIHARTGLSTISSEGKHETLKGAVLSTDQGVNHIGGKKGIK